MVDMLRRAPPVPNAVWLKRLPPAARFAFHGGAEARAAAQPVWGAAFSTTACRATVHERRATLWLGPDEYLLMDLDGGAPARTPGGGVPDAAFAALEQVLSNIPHALVDVSHRQFALEVSGPHAATILSGACPLDLDLAQFPVDMCTRTVLAKAEVTLWRRPEAFHLEIWRSFAGYVTGILTEIAAEFYPAG